MQIWVKIHQGSWCCTRKTEDKESKTENRMALECQPGCEDHGLYPSGLQLHQGFNPNSPTSPDSALTKYRRCLPSLLLKQVRFVKTLHISWVYIPRPSFANFFHCLQPNLIKYINSVSIVIMFCAIVSYLFLDGHYALVTIFRPPVSLVVSKTVGFFLFFCGVFFGRKDEDLDTL